MIHHMLSVALVASIASVEASFTDSSVVRQDDRLMAIERFAQTRGDDALEEFFAEHIDPEYARSDDELRARLERVRQTCGNAGGISVEALGEGRFEITFDGGSGRQVVAVQLSQDPEGRITKLELREGEARASLEALTWENLYESLDGFESDGFAGSVLVVRDDVPILHRGYGFADESKGVRNHPHTVFAIGSVPIDFTKAAVLRLAEQDKLALDDPITKYFSDVPDDKRAITIDQLMSGRSGLRNFHGDRAVDEDLDLSYIDRPEALRRIFASELLFEPGTRYAHSHSAWGVLAAVVEVVSGTSYGDFLQEEFFERAGMQRTGLYPLAEKIDTDEIAVGPGTTFGRPNAPQHWGKTSWLVMGSGGMVSTTGDLYRWLRAMHAGELLSPSSLELFWVGSVLAGGNDRGFGCCYTEGPDTLAIVCSNSETGMDSLSAQVQRAIMELILESSPRPFRLGVRYEVSPQGIVIVDVTDGGAAKSAGLRAGDRLHSIDGDKDPINMSGRIDAATRSGHALAVVVERDGERVELTLRPQPGE